MGSRCRFSRTRHQLGLFSHHSRHDGIPVAARSDERWDQFIPALRGDSLGCKAIYWHFPHDSNRGIQSPDWAIHEGDHKLLEYYENNTVQLFDLKDDIGEQNDIAAEMPARAEQLRRKLREWREQIAATIMEQNPDGVRTPVPGC